ncbi:YihY/virulence factor BrkB family protein [Arthrobacter glacialis]|uniref:Ribonuclease BN n=1 Tax=Arthrobacter glacialis TaxID=1664 RepID=A0A2S3ZZX9_ARTGL|nr:YihY/virulence factor BrkB family protein [Arthrobacter glacialis]POH60081.1 ribonuclease BN [Arthrobacter glacialis]POH74778.1 ribonuclease BN [Arthrobacter glacialis]
MGEANQRERAGTGYFPGTVAPGVRAKRPLAAALQPPPSPLDRKALAAWTQSKHAAYQEAKTGGKFVPKVGALFQWLNARAGQMFPLRMWNLYTRRRGPLLAAGNAYLMFFSVVAMLVAGFAIFGMIVSDNPVLQDAVVDMVAGTTPGLIDTGDGGLATPEQLLESTDFGLTLVISLIALLITALGWINGLREGIRSVLGLAPDRTNPVLSKLLDGGTLLVLAVALVLTSALGALSTAAVGNISEFLGWGTFLTGFSAQLGSVFLMFVLDVAVAIVMFSMASRVRMPRRVLLLASVFSGAGATILRFFSALLLNGVTNNALLAPFAVILGLFVWFFLLSQVYLIAAAIAAVRAADLRPRPAKP